MKDVANTETRKDRAGHLAKHDAAKVVKPNPEQVEDAKRNIDASAPMGSGLDGKPKRIVR